MVVPCHRCAWYDIICTQKIDNLKFIIIKQLWCDMWRDRMAVRNEKGIGEGRVKAEQNSRGQAVSPKQPGQVKQDKAGRQAKDVTEGRQHDCKHKWCLQYYCKLARNAGMTLIPIDGFILMNRWAGSCSPAMHGLTVCPSCMMHVIHDDSNRKKIDCLCKKHCGSMHIEQGDICPHSNRSQMEPSILCHQDSLTLHR